MDWDLRTAAAAAAGRMPPGASTMEWAEHLARQYSGTAAGAAYYAPPHQQQAQYPPPYAAAAAGAALPHREETKEEELHRIRTVNELFRTEANNTAAAAEPDHEPAQAEPEDRRVRFSDKKKKAAPPRKKRKLPNNVGAVAAADSDAEEEEDEEQEDEEAPVKVYTTKNTLTCNPRSKYRGGPSTYGNKENPLLSSYGMIDGRSNAQACFEQKVQLCKEFKAQHGHLRIPQYPADPKSKYRRLYAFLLNQRKFYRAYLKGEKVPLTPERIALLDELGDWIKPVGDERWPSMLQKLTDFYNEHGHTCVGADRSFAKANPSLVTFSQRCRFNFKAWVEKQEYLQRKKEAGESPSETDASMSEAPTDVEGGNATETAMTDGEDNNNDPDDDKQADATSKENTTTDDQATTTRTTKVGKPKATNAAAVAATNDDTNDDKDKPDDKKTDGEKDKQDEQKKNPKKRKELPAYAPRQPYRSKKGLPRFARIDAHYNQEKHNILKQFQCPYLESCDERKEYCIQNNKLFTNVWFHGFEVFKDHRKNNPDDIILAFRKGKTKWTPVQHWVKRQRKIYAKIQGTDLMTKEGPIKKFYEKLLNDYKLMLDPKQVKQAEEEVTRKERIEAYKKEQEEKKKQTPEYKLELAQQEEAEAKTKLNEAREKLKQAQAVAKEALSVYNKAKSEVTKWKSQITKDQDCRFVMVKKRGGNKPEGRARVLNVTERKVGKLPTMYFYDLIFDEGGETEFFVDGMFVTQCEAPAKAKAASTTPTPTRIKTRQRAKEEAEEAEEHVENAHLVI